MPNPDERQQRQDERRQDHADKKEELANEKAAREAERAKRKQERADAGLPPDPDDDDAPHPDQTLPGDLPKA